VNAARVTLRSMLPLALVLPVLWAIQAGIDPYRENILINVGVNVILAVSLNVVNGFTG
jgi:branched-chain amino acid transport system permease protein